MGPQQRNRSTLSMLFSQLDRIAQGNGKSIRTGIDDPFICFLQMFFFWHVKVYGRLGCVCERTREKACGRGREMMVESFQKVCAYVCVESGVCGAGRAYGKGLCIWLVVVVVKKRLFPIGNVQKSVKWKVPTHCTQAVGAWNERENRNFAKGKSLFCINRLDGMERDYRERSRCNKLLPHYIK